jgi:polyisoprenoid-binding protein YceI
MKALFFVFALGLSFSGRTQHYEPLDAASSVKFKIKNFGTTVEGSFRGLKGAILFSPDELSVSRFDVSVAASTIDTGIALRNKHLKKEDYFDVNKFGEIHFVSTKIEPSTPANKFTVTGKLTIKKTTKEVKFDFVATKKGVDYQFNGEFLINRREYDIGRSSFSMSDEVIVLITANCQAEKI